MLLLRRCSARVIACICVVTSLSASLHTTASATESNYTSVELIPVAESDILAANSSDALDSLLYPNGVALPTKYLDICMLAENDMESMPVSLEAWDVLSQYFPSDSGKYTFAECYAAQLYVGWYYTVYRGYLGEETENAVDEAELLKSGTSNIGLALCGEVDDVRVTNLVTLKQYLSDYVDSAISDSDGVTKDGIVSMGVDYAWEVTSWTPLLGLDYQKLGSFLSTRGVYLDAIGAEYTNTGTQIFEDPFAVTSTAASNAVVGSQSAAPDSDSSSSSYNLASTDSNPSIGDLGSDAVTVSAVTKSIGVRDVLTVLCIILVFCAFFGMWVVDIIRRRKDPLRKWRWWK